MRFSAFCLLIAIFLYSCGPQDPDSQYVFTDWREATIDESNFVYNGVGYLKNWTGSYNDNPTGSGNTYYIDPVNGSQDGDGSASNPWRTLQQVIEDGYIQSYNRPASDSSRVLINPGAPIHAGDVIILREGNHGLVSLREYYNDYMITIRAAANERPAVKYIRIISCSNWRFDGLYISPEIAMTEFNVEALFSVYSYNSLESSKIELYNSKLYSVWNTQGWNIYDWNFISQKGVVVNGTEVVIENNFLQNISFSITINGDNNRIVNNTINNFSGDAMRGNGNDLLFEANFVKNVHRVNSLNHYDSFQSFCTGEITEWNNVTLRRNVILAYENPNQPFKGQVQGLGCFDGFYRNWLIEKNVIIVDHWHGITLQGTTGTTIRNNIVVDINNVEPGPAKITIRPHKDGTPSQNCTVSNNISHSFNLIGINITDTNNTTILIEDLDTIFVDPANYDFRLIDSSILN